MRGFNFLEFPVLSESLHISSMLILLLKLGISRSSAGVSGKTLVLLAFTYTFRAMDLWAFWVWESWQTSFVKIFYMSITYLLLYLTYSVHRSTVEWDLDSFRLSLLVIPVSMLSYIINERKKITQLTYTWSLFMESSSQVPQLFMMWKSQNVDTLTGCYVLLFGIYIGIRRYSWYLANNGVMRGTFAAQLIIDCMVGLCGILGACFATIGYRIENHLLSSADFKLADTIGKSVKNKMKC